MVTKLQARIAEIRKRVEEHHKHENDPYVYHPWEIDAIREFRDHALEDIEFLLAQLTEKSH